MEEILRQIAIANGWGYLYGTQAYQNLIDSDDTNVQMIVDPITIESNFNDSGAVESSLESGTFYLVLSSELDEGDYETRYEKYIEPLRSSLKIVTDVLQCNDNVTQKAWKTVEVINMLDNNYDGIMVTYSVNCHE